MLRRRRKDNCGEIPSFHELPKADDEEDRYGVILAFHWLHKTENMGNCKVAALPEESKLGKFTLSSGRKIHPFEKAHLVKPDVVERLRKQFEMTLGNNKKKGKCRQIKSKGKVDVAGTSSNFQVLCLKICDKFAKDCNRGAA